MIRNDLHVARVDHIVTQIIDPYEPPQYDETTSSHEYLLDHVRHITSQIERFTEARQYLFAYARHLIINGHPYTLASLAEAARMSITEVHAAYDDEVVFDAIVLLASCRHPDRLPSATSRVTGPVRAIGGSGRAG